MQFYSHPLIEIISQHVRMNIKALLPICGMTKSSYKIELRKLIKDGHLIDDGEQLYPRCLTLRVNDKRSGRFLKEIETNYVSRDDLNEVVHYNENEEAFMDGVILTEEQARYFEGANGLIFDYKRSNYRLYVSYANLNYNPLGGLGAYSDTKIPIVHLDFYSLFAKGLETLLQNSFVQEFDWNYFNNPEEALLFITEEFKANRYLHFIITDISVVKGCEFAKEVKRLEGEFNYRHTPIMALTMHDESSSVMVEAKKENLFTAHFTKDLEPEAMINYINTIPYQT